MGMPIVSWIEQINPALYFARSTMTSGWIGGGGESVPAQREHEWPGISTGLNDSVRENQDKIWEVKAQRKEEREVPDEGLALMYATANDEGAARDVSEMLFPP